MLCIPPPTSESSTTIIYSKYHKYFALYSLKLVFICLKAQTQHFLRRTFLSFGEEAFFAPMAEPWQTNVSFPALELFLKTSKQVEQGAESVIPNLWFQCVQSSYLFSLIGIVE